MRKHIPVDTGPGGRALDWATGGEAPPHQGPAFFPSLEGQRAHPDGLCQGSTKCLLSASCPLVSLGGPAVVTLAPPRMAAFSSSGRASRLIRTTEGCLQAIADERASGEHPALVPGILRVGHRAADPAWRFHPGARTEGY